MKFSLPWFALLLSQINLFTYKYVVIPHIKKGDENQKQK